LLDTNIHNIFNEDGIGKVSSTRNIEKL